MYKIKLVLLSFLLCIFPYIASSQTVLPSFNTARLMERGQTELHVGFNFKSKSNVQAGRNQYYAQLFDMRLLYGIADNVAIAARFPVWTLSGTSRFVHGFGDVQIGVKIRLTAEDKIWPQTAFRFQTKLPNASDEKALGSDLTDFFFDALASKAIGRSSLNAALGMGIFSDTRTCLPRQFDVVLGNAAWTTPVLSRLLLRGGIEFMFGANHNVIDDKLHLSLEVIIPFKRWFFTAEYSKRIYGDNHDIGTPFRYSRGHMLRIFIVFQH